MCEKLREKSFDMSNMGEAALSSHVKGTKHIQHEKSVRDGLPIQVFFNSTKTMVRPSGPGSAFDQSTVATATQNTLDFSC